MILCLWERKEQKGYSLRLRQRPKCFLPVCPYIIGETGGDGEWEGPPSTGTVGDSQGTEMVFTSGVAEEGSPHEKMPRWRECGCKPPNLRSLLFSRAVVATFDKMPFLPATHQSPREKVIGTSTKGGGKGWY